MTPARQIAPGGRARWRGQRAVPIVSTLVVLAAVAAMAGLGFWQLDRRQEKESLLARYAAAQDDPREIVWSGQDFASLPLYRRVVLECVGIDGQSAIAGRRRDGTVGYARTALCHLPHGASVRLVLGWAQRPDTVTNWQGGIVHGTIAPGPRLVADPAVGKLAAMARPDPAELPNNHLSYAIQWFAFALTALVIYAIVLRQRRRS